MTRTMHELHLILQNPKAFLAALTAFGSFLADAATDLKGWEDLTLKGVLVVAIIYLVREMSRARDEHKAESLKREERQEAVIKENTDTLADLVTITKEQTTYLKDVARTIIEKELKRDKP